MIPAFPPLGCDLMSWIHLYGISVVMYSDGSCGYYSLPC
jgi:hypothetical protein